METPIEGLGLLHMRGSGVEGLIIFIRFIFSPAGIFRPYIELRETHKSSVSFLDVHSKRDPQKFGQCFRCSFWKPSGLSP